MNTHLGIIGKKLGCTQVFGEDGTVTRVTVVQCNECVVVGKRTVEKDGYSALQLGWGKRKDKHTTKPVATAFKKRNVATPSMVREFRLSAEDVAKFEVGQALKPSDVLKVGQFVDVSGKSRGRGFTGVMARWNFRGQGTDTHGTHEYRRHGGAIGTNMTPGRTLPNLKMPGHYGDERVTIHNQKIAQIKDDESLLLIEGAIPGARNAIVTVRGAIKKKAAQA